MPAETTNLFLLLGIPLTKAHLSDGILTNKVSIITPSLLDFIFNYGQYKLSNQQSFFRSAFSFHHKNNPTESLASSF
ncbi:hypothetical protein BZG02_18795 [Labilibaculum filiforme]|uniref:Uncharacterized protein n=1 Tax=Labilibaculum filiforme TaxID=1940526 RepID=A0A2N3HR32_9BACT|nr:hypothetical protein BZG02_18795 [Labilibaculum filiforme]